MYKISQFITGQALLLLSMFANNWFRKIGSTGCQCWIPKRKKVGGMRGRTALPCLALSGLELFIWLVFFWRVFLNHWIFCVFISLHNLLLLVLHQSLSDGEKACLLCGNSIIQLLKAAVWILLFSLYFISNGTIQIVSLAQGYTMRVIKCLCIASNLCHKELQKRHPNATLKLKWQFISAL